jgi:hypothetical protein
MAIDEDRVHLPHKKFNSDEWCYSPEAYFTLDGTVDPVHYYIVRLIDRVAELERKSIEDMNWTYQQAEREKIFQEAEAKRKQASEMLELFYFNLKGNAENAKDNQC